MTPPEHALPEIPARPDDAHKGTAGTIAVIGGCARTTRMIGAPALAARGSFRAGCGLVKVLAPEPILNSVITLEPSATGIALNVDDAGAIVPHRAAETLDSVFDSLDCLVAGPGLGDGPEIESIALRAIQQDETPVVIDADAINALARVPELSRELRAPSVFTPHPGEFRRLAEQRKVTADPTDSALRPQACEQLAQRLGAIVVLKGAGTVVSDGQRTRINDTGHPCLATAGTGDVLAGVIAAFVSQFAAPAPPPGLPESVRAKMPRPANKPLDLFDTTRLAVRVHGLAGELWAQHNADRGLLARELADLIPQAMKQR